MYWGSTVYQAVCQALEIHKLVKWSPSFHVSLQPSCVQTCGDPASPPSQLKVSVQGLHASRGVSAPYIRAPFCSKVPASLTQKPCLVRGCRGVRVVHPLIMLQ